MCSGGAERQAGKACSNFQALIVIIHISRYLHWVSRNIQTAHAMQNQHRKEHPRAARTRINRSGIAAQ